jgi:hypothetical protein
MGAYIAFGVILVLATAVLAGLIIWGRALLNKEE